eukprot:11288545-Alexandrium_andersonii.AAC.1
MSAARSEVVVGGAALRAALPASGSAVRGSVKFADSEPRRGPCWPARRAGTAASPSWARDKAVNSGQR